MTPILETALAWITSYYGDRCAERSGVPLINHIHEGLAILDHLGANESTKAAFCVHPLFQGDDVLLNSVFHGRHCDLDADTLLLVMEFRSQANAWLSDKVGWDKRDEVATAIGAPSPGPLPEVRLMLIADKVQNYADFVQYHYGAHPRSGELNAYFHTWFTVLDVNLIDYENLTTIIDRVRALGRS